MSKKPRGMSDSYYDHTRHVGIVPGCPHCPSPFNDPPADSLFEKVSETLNICTVCLATVSNSTEARDAHLNEKGCHVG